MARLREQARLVEAACNYCDGNDEQFVPKSVANMADIMTGVMSEAEIVNSGLKSRIFNDEKNSFATTPKDKGYWRRRHRIGVLFKNSVNDGFFIKDKSKEKEEKIVDHYSITGDGTDLLHWLGFLRIATQKYSKTVMFVWGLVGGAVITGAPYLLALLTK